jgi:hypothetical protein
MMGHTEELLKKWGGGTVILSPRDLEDAQLVKMAEKARKAGGEALLDPQCFLRDADHHRLTKHEYWKTYKACSTSNILTGNGARNLLKTLGELDRRLKLERHILPGLMASEVDKDWLGFHEQMIQAGQKEFPTETLLATVALSTEAIRDETQVESLIERATKWPVAGFYVVAEASSQYLVDDPSWLANVLILASGLKLLGKTVIVGYANHQLLCLAAGNIDAMASGTWLNVRAFPTKKFYMRPEDEQSRRTTWYYCPQALSEYKITFLDIAMRNGVLDLMKPDSSLGSSYADPLFGGAQPTTVGWKESQAFRHYLTCLHGQCQQATAGSFDDAVKKHKALLDTAKPVLKKLEDNGVFADYRSLGPILNVNRGALITFERARGPRLRREWR